MTTKEDNLKESVRLMSKKMDEDHKLIVRYGNKILKLEEQIKKLKAENKILEREAHNYEHAYEYLMDDVEIWDLIPEEERKEVDKKLKKWGL